MVKLSPCPVRGGHFLFSSLNVNMIALDFSLVSLVCSCFRVCWANFFSNYSTDARATL